MIRKYREIIEKNNWHENEDIYELYSENALVIYGHNGRYYIFGYKNDDVWVIKMYPADIQNKKVWHGFGKGWEDIINESRSEG